MCHLRLLCVSPESAQKRIVQVLEPSPAQIGTRPKWNLRNHSFSAVFPLPIDEVRAGEARTTLGNSLIFFYPAHRKVKQITWNLPLTHVGPSFYDANDVVITTLIVLHF